MAQAPAELLVESVLKMEAVRHSVAVAKEDGTMVKASDGAPGNLGEVVAFLGSAAEVISSNLELGDLSSVLAEGQNHKMLILPHETVYLGVDLDPAQSPWWVLQPSPLDLLLESKTTKISEAEELLKQKLILVNLLLEEFGALGEKAPEWQEMLAYELKNVDPLGRLAKMVTAGPGSISHNEGVKTDISKKEVSDAFEKLVNSTCKKAIACLGFVAVKQKFQIVISRLASGNR